LKKQIQSELFIYTEAMFSRCVIDRDKKERRIIYGGFLSFMLFDYNIHGSGLIQNKRE